MTAKNVVKVLTYRIQPIDSSIQLWFQAAFHSLHSLDKQLILFQFLLQSYTQPMGSCILFKRQNFRQPNPQESIQSPKKKISVVTSPTRESQMLQVFQEIQVIDHAVVDKEKLYVVKDDQMGQRLHKFQAAIVWRLSKHEGSAVGRGSGLIISPNIVLTCAHNFYREMQLIDIGRVDIYPGAFGLLQKSKAYKIEKIFIPKEYRNRPHKLNIKFDYALVKLSKKVNMEAFIPLGWDQRQKFETEKIAIFGYPDNNYVNVNKMEELETVFQSGLIGDDKKLLKIDEAKEQIHHTISTIQGESGSPIILMQAQVSGQYKLSVLGVHKGTVKSLANDSTYNIGKLMSRQLIDLLQEETLILGGQAFLQRNGEEQACEKLGPKKILQRAQNFQSNKKYGKAIFCYKKVLEKEENDFTVYRELGKCCIQLKIFDQAVVHLRKAVQLNKNDALSYESLGYALFSNKKWTQAIRNLEKALNIDPNNPDTHNYLGAAYSEMKQFEKAIESFKKAKQLDPKHFQAFFNLGKAFKFMQKKEEAIQCFEKAIQINQAYTQAYNGLGMIHYEFSEWQQAIKNFSKAVELDPNYQSAFNNLGNAYKAKGQIKNAIENYQIATRINPNYTLAFQNLGVALSLASRFEKAVQCFQKAIKHNPNHSQFYNNLGSVYYSQKKWDEAKQEYSKAIEIKENNYQAYFNLGNTYKNMKKFEEAIYNYRKTIQYNQNFKQAYFQLGLAYKAVDSNTQAIESFKKCLIYDPQHARAKLERELLQSKKK